MFVVLLLFVAANFWCWRPGIGPGRTGPPGTELELYYGWPATYQAEWWRSEDATLQGRILRSVPFYSFAAEMELRNRYFGFLAAVANLAFAGAALCAAVILSESAARQRHLSRGELIALLVAAVVVVAVLAASESISQHV